jgi:dCMP deaminase
MTTDWSQVDRVTLIDYEDTGKEIDLVYTSGLVYFYFPSGEKKVEVGINLETLEDAIDYLRTQQNKLVRRVGASDYTVSQKPDQWFVSTPRETAARPSWEEYAITLARAAATRSEDPYVQVGAVILRADHTVASVGYNGAPAGVEIDWSDRDERRKRVIHAEANALRYVQPGELENGLLAATMLPCLECLKMARAQGVKTIVYDESVTANYDADDIFKIAKEFGVTLRQVSLVPGENAE